MPKTKLDGAEEPTINNFLNAFDVGLMIMVWYPKRSLDPYFNFSPT